MELLLQTSFCDTPKNPCDRKSPANGDCGLPKIGEDLSHQVIDVGCPSTFVGVFVVQMSPSLALASLELLPLKWTTLLLK